MRLPTAAALTVALTAGTAAAAPRTKAAILDVQGDADAATLEWMTQQWRADAKAVAAFEWVTPMATLADLQLVLDCADLDNACFATIGQNLGAGALFFARVAGAKVSFERRDAGGRVAASDAATVAGADAERVKAFAAAGVRFVRGERAEAAAPPPPPALAPFPAPAPAGGPAKVRVSVEPAGAEVRVDGVGRGLAPVEIAGLVPGDHLVEARLKGHRAQSQKFRVDPAKSLELRLTLEREGRPAASAPVAAPKPGVAAAPPAPAPKPVAAAAPVAADDDEPGVRASSSPLGRIRWPAWAAAGVSGALLATGVVLGLSARSAEADLNDPALDCAAASEYGQCRDLEDRARGRALAANVAIGVAGAAAVATGVLVYLDLRAGSAGAGVSASF